MTHNRVPSLLACLESYITNCRRHGRTAEFVVMDDGATDDGATGDQAGAEKGSPIRVALRDLQATGDETIRYAGPAEKRRFAEHLARESSIPRDIIDFALFGDRRCRRFTGANRNSLLLDTVGAVVFGADDDTLALTAVGPESHAGEQNGESVAFSSAYEPRELWFFPDRRAALEAITPTEIDFLAATERFLGRTLVEVASTAGLRFGELSPADLSPAGVSAASAVGIIPEGPSGDGLNAAEPEGRIVITLPGLVGDSGMGSARHFLTLSGPSRERLLASQAAYLSALRSREVLRTARRPTIAPSGFCMTGFFGFDNRLILPPFFPVERNSDGIFGLMVRRAVEGSRVAFLPTVLLHAPREARTFSGDEAWRGPERVSIADVLIAPILAQDAGKAVIAGGAAAGDGPRLQQLGGYLGDLASLRLEEFEAFVASAQHLRVFTFTSVLESRLSEHDASPAFWADDVRKTIELLRRAPATKDYIVPRDLGDARNVDGARRLARELVAKFGELVEAWPPLVEAARRLRSKGIRLSDPV